MLYFYGLIVKNCYLCVTWISALDSRTSPIFPTGILVFLILVVLLFLSLLSGQGEIIPVSSKALTAIGPATWFPNSRVQESRSPISCEYS
jgi:hypothetical protein